MIKKIRYALRFKQAPLNWPEDHWYYDRGWCESWWSWKYRRLTKRVFDVITRLI